MIVIVGGGISGLALAHELAARARPFLLLESSSRAGGVIRSGRVDGRLLEWGPQRGRLTREFAALVDELGLRDRLITAPPDLPLFVFSDGRLRRVPFSAAAFISSDILPLRAKLRVLREPFTAGPAPDETVADFFIRKLGRAGYERLAGPLYGGLYASDPREMVVGLSLAHVLREFGIGRSLLLPLVRRRGTIATPDAVSFVDGMETLPRALLDRHRAHIRLDAPVRSITRDGAKWIVATDADHFVADDVVVATPAGAAAGLLAGAVPDAAARIARLRYNPLAVVHLLADTQLHGFGYQVSFGERLVTRGVTWNDSLFAHSATGDAGRSGVYTAYLGGALNREVADEPHDSLGRTAVQEFRTVTGCDARVLSVRLEWMPAWDSSWEATRSLQLPSGLHLHTNWTARPGLPGRLALARQIAARLT